MTMHLVRGLSTIGKRKAKPKFKSAEHKRLYEQLNQEWSEIKSRHKVDVDLSKKNRAMVAETYVPTKSYTRGSTSHIPSRDTGHTGAISSKQTPQYTGDKIIGIGTLHKSNAVPIFTEEEAHDISKMRR